MALSARHANQHQYRRISSQRSCEPALCEEAQMRWTNKGAHLLVQVRVAVLNGDLKMSEMRNRCNSTQSENVTFAANVLPSPASGSDYSRLILALISDTGSPVDSR